MNLFAGSFCLAHGHCWLSSMTFLCGFFCELSRSCHERVGFARTDR